MWTDITRAQHARKDLRLPSDLTDAEWQFFEPLMPRAAKTGRPRKWGWRNILEAMLFLLRGGLPWRMLPPDLFPPVSTVQRWFYAWRDNGLWRAINHELVMLVREVEGREASPSACVIDSQSVKTTESGGPQGFDAGKKVKGRKRHILTDTIGLMLEAVVHTADIQSLPPRRRGIEMVDRRFSSIFTSATHFFPIFLPMEVMPAISSRRRPPKLVNGRSKSSSDLTPPKDSYCSPDDGSLSELSLGSIATADSRRISKPRLRARPPGCFSHPFNFSPENSQSADI